MIGPIVNSAAIVIGSGIGTLLGHKIPLEVQKRMPIVFGLASMGLGIAMFIKLKLLAAVILTLLIGTMLGEILQLEERIKLFAGYLKKVVERFISSPNVSLQHQDYMETFMSILILFSMSATGIFGSINEGVTGNPTLLIVKSFLDFFTAAIFAIRLGMPVAMLALPQCLIQLILYFSASSIVPLINASMIADFSAVGGLIMFATGFRICGILNYPIANMIPCLLIAMPVSAMWSHLLLLLN
jgi:uncharacterized membrane protein YqgA involved in biofilm formation